MPGKKPHPRLAAFLHAGRGVAWGLRTQPHLRFHLFAAIVVLLVMHLAKVGGVGLEPLSIVAVLILIGAVLSLELLNSALEIAADAITRDHNPLIGRAKDAAAGAVLVMSAFASLIGLMVVLPLAIQVAYCENVLRARSFPATVALLVFYLVHHFLARRKGAWIFAVAAFWAAGFVAFESAWWLGLCLWMATTLGLYGDLKREAVPA